METSEVIIAKALEFFISGGANSVTVTRIVDSLKIGEEEVYNILKNKEAIILAVVTRLIDNCKTLFKSISASTHDEIAELFYMVSHAHKIYKQISYAIIKSDFERDCAEAYKYLKDFRCDFLFQTLQSVIIRGQARGLFRDNFNVSTVLNYLLESIAVIPADSSGENTVNIEEIFDLLVSGITTMHGAEVLKNYRDQFAIVAIFPSFRNEFLWDH
jgi:AcrR family transcriptional regulator